MSWKKYSRNNSHLLLLLGLVITSVGIASFYNLKYIHWDYAFFPYVGPGRIFNYYVNYFEFGFIKRGLVASVIKALIGYPTVRTVHWIGYSVSMMACVTGAYLIYRMRSYFAGTAFIFFAIFAVFNSATFANLGFHLGWLDHLLIICSFSSLYFIRRHKIFPLIIITVLALLIHEIYLILFFPVIAYIIWFRSDFTIRQIAYLSLSMVFVLLMLFFFGKIEGMTYQEIAKTFDIQGYTFGDYGIIWTRDLASNFYYTMDFITTTHYNRLFSWIIGGLYMVGVFGVIISIAIYNNLDLKGYLVILLCSLIIFPIAIDYSRWYGLMIINAFIYFGFSVFESEKSKPIELMQWHYWIIAVFVIVSMVLGPIGYGRSFPLFNFF